MTKAAPQGKAIQGMGIALITPFLPDNTIDYPALASLIDFQITQGADFIVALGTTAETPTLTPDERATLRQFISQKVNGRIPLVIGIGGNSTAAVIDEITSSDLSTFDAILSVTPFYNKPSQEGIFRHFTAIADASPLPIILYNVPGRTGVNITPDTVARLAAHPRIIAIKEASGSVTQTAEIIRRAPQDFIVLSGDDGLTLPLIALGAKGVISVLGNAFPAEFSTMVRLALQGQTDKAAKIHHTLGPLFRLLFIDGNPAGIKHLLSLQNRCADILRLPLIPVTPDTASKINHFLSSKNQK